MPYNPAVYSSYVPAANIFIQPPLLNKIVIFSFKFGILEDDKTEN